MIAIVISRNFITRTDLLKISIHSYNKCLNPSGMPGKVLDPEDTDKNNMLPFCSNSSYCSKDRQQTDNDHTGRRCSDNLYLN